MALHDFRCSTCGAIQRDINVPIEIGASGAFVYCRSCTVVVNGEHTAVRMQWIPAIGRMDAANGPGFVAFDCYDGQNNKVHVSSLKQLRDLERTSEQQFKNGEGQPLVFRAFSNDPTNKDSSALHKSWNGGEQPTAEAAHKYGSTLQKATDAPDVGFGPGVDESNTSALGMEP